MEEKIMEEKILQFEMLLNDYEYALLNGKSGTLDMYVTLVDRYRDALEGDVVDETKGQTPKGERYENYE